MRCPALLLPELVAFAIVIPPTLHAQEDSTGPRVVIHVDSLDRASFANIGELLQARVPGLHVARTGDGGVRWFMRGPASLRESHPMIVIDDVRMNVAGSAREEIGTRPPLIDEIDVEDVERIEVWSGGATTGHFGTGAANGVIRIVTTAPRAGPLSLRLATAGSVANENATYPSNFTRPGITSSGTTVRCTLSAEAVEFCTPSGPFTSINVLETDTPYETALGARVSASITGGQEVVAWRAATTFDRQGSVAGHLAGQRLHLSGSAALRPVQTGELTLRAHWTRSDADLPWPAFPWGSRLQQGLFAPADSVWRGFIEPPVSAYNSMRYGGTLAGEWHPRDWLDASFTSGIARMADENDLEYTVPAGVIFPPGTVRERSERRRHEWNARLDAEARYGTGFLRHATALTVEHATWRQEEEFSAVARGFWINRPTTIAGVGLRQRLHLGRRGTLVAGARVDQVRVSELRWDVPVAPHLSITWDASPLGGMGWWRLKLRAALGDVANVPQTTPATFIVLGEPERPKAEVTREREVGFDVSVLRNRIGTSLTWYIKRTSNVGTIVAGPQAGFPTFARIEVLNRGIEASLDARIVQGSRFDWSARAAYTYNHNEVTRGVRTPLLIDQDLFAGASFNFRQWVAPGHSLGAHRSTPIVSIRDLDGDGLLDNVCLGGNSCEVIVDGEEFRPAYPPTSASVETSLRYQAFTLSALVDHRSGHVMQNATTDGRCFRECRALYDRSTPLREQAEAMLGGGFPGMPAQEAGYTKLREVSLRFEAPTPWARALGVARLSIGVAGRNLATWTDYPGLDPETMSMHWNPVMHVDRAAEPLPRRFAIRLTAVK